jgi:hypothetical protein
MLQLLSTMVYKGDPGIESREEAKNQMHNGTDRRAQR